MGEWMYNNNNDNNNNEEDSSITVNPMWMCVERTSADTQRCVIYIPLRNAIPRNTRKYFMKKWNAALIRLSSDASLCRYDPNTGGRITELQNTTVSEKTAQERINATLLPATGALSALRLCVSTLWFSYLCNRPWRPVGLWDVEAPTFSLDNRLIDGGEFVSLTRWPAALYPQEDSWDSSLLEAESTPGLKYGWNKLETFPACVA
jgi:hypothetical protein